MVVSHHYLLNKQKLKYHLSRWYCWPRFCIRREKNLRVRSYRPFSSQLFFIFFLHNSSQRDLSNEISLITHLTMQGLYKAMLLRLQTLFLMFWEKSSKNSKYHHFLYFSYFYFIWFCCGNNAFCMISFFYLRF